MTVHKAIRVQVHLGDENGETSLGLDWTEIVKLLGLLDTAQDGLVIEFRVVASFRVMVAMGAVLYALLAAMGVTVAVLWLGHSSRGAR